MNKTRRTLFALSLAALASILWLSFSRNPAGVPSVSSVAKKEATVSSVPASRSLTPTTESNDANRRLKPVPPPAGSVKVTPPLPDAPEAVKAFREWAANYFLAEPAQRALLEANGEKLAKEHRKAIAQLITSDPKSAIDNAVPMVLRQDLPEGILEKLEKRINSRGQLLVAGVVGPDHPTPAIGKAIQRYFIPEGQDPSVKKQRYVANVYGQRSEQHTLASTRVNGVSVDAQLAVFDSAVRQLEVGERPDPTKEIVTACPISGIETKVESKPGEVIPPITDETPAIQDNRTIRFVCSGGHIQEYASRLTEEEREEHWQSQGIAAEGGTGGGLQPFNPPPGWTTGTSTLLYIRCAFPEQGNDPQSESECYANLKQTTDYFMESSRGRFYLTPTVAPLVVLPHPESWYNASVDGSGNADGDFVIYDQARTIAARMGYDTANFDLDVVRWDNGPGSYGGLGSVGGKLVILKSSSVGVLMHELGHNLGLWHSNYWQTNPPSAVGRGQNVEYGNIFDVMGSSGSLGHYVAVHKAQIGWLTEDQFHDVRSNGTFRIFQTDQGQSDAGKRYALKVTRDSERDYWLELRQQFTTYPALFNGLMLTWDSWGYGTGQQNGTNYGSNRGAQLIDSTPGSGSFSDTRHDAAIAIGRTYTDKDVNLHITPIVKGTVSPPYIDVVVNRGPFPGNRPPTLSLVASGTAPGAGVSVAFTAAANDPDGDTVAYSWDFGDGSFSTDNLRTQSKSWTSAGVYRVTCTASDMKGLHATKGVLVNVAGGGTGFTVSGNITDQSGSPIEGLYVANRTLIAAPAQPAIAAFRYSITDSNGGYAMTNLPAGNLTVTPHLPPYTFSPSFPNPLNVQASSSGRDLQAGGLPTSGIITVTVTDPDAGEAGGNTAQFTITRSGATTGTLDVPFLLGSSGTAVRNTDYSLTPALFAVPNSGGVNSFRFAAAQSTITVTLSVLPDVQKEGEEYAVIELPDAVPNFTRIGPKTITIPIADDDTSNSVVTLIQAEPSASEDGDVARFIVKRNGVDISSDLTVDLAYGTPASPLNPAILNTDFFAPTSVVIPANASSATVTISAFDDIYAEGTEFATVTLASSPNYARDTKQRSGQFYITDNDQPQLTISAADAAASEAGNNPGKFRISRVAKDLSTPLTVQYSMGGTALEGSDYRRVDGSAVIPAHELYVDIEINPIDDSIDEDDQTVICRLATDDAYSITSPGTATVTIADNDSPEISIRTLPVAGGRLIEPTNGTANRNVFQVTRPQAGTSLSIPITFTGTANKNSDYSNYPSTVSFLSTEVAVNVSMDIVDDPDQENLETIIATLSTGSGYRLAANKSATSYLMDGDQPSVDISLADSSSSFAPLSEGSGNFDFIVARTGSTALDLSVSFSLTGTATVATDYTASAATNVLIPAGAASSRITIALINDSVAEGTETIVATLGTSSAWGAGTRTATAYIADNDAYAGGSPPTVQFGAATSSINEKTGATTPLQIPVSITGTRSGPVTVSYFVSGGSANGNGVDYTLSGGTLTPAELTTGTLTFAVADTSKNITLTTTADSMSEGLETVRLSLVYNFGTNIGGQSTHTVTIMDIAVPDALTDTISNLPGNTATLRGKAAPNGVATDAWFEWGTNGTAFPNTTTHEAIGTGSTLVNLTAASITGLTYPGTYYYRTVAQNAQGTTRGITRTIRTAAPPVGNTLLTPIHTANSASLQGSINPNRLNAEVWFEWGTTTGYGNLTPRQGVVASTVSVPVSAPITGLVEGTIYHYRMMALTSLGSVTGDDMVVAAIPQVVAGELFVNLLAKNPTAGSATWTNQGTLGDFIRSGNPSAVANVANTAIPGVFFDDALAAYTGPAANADIAGNSNRTMEVWAYNPGYGAKDELVSIGRDGSHTATVLRNNGLGGAEQGSDDLVSTTATAPGSWHHFVYTYDGAKNATFYVDGVKKASKKLATDLATTLDPVALGYGFDSAGVAKAKTFNGYINTVRVHGGALSAAEVLTNYKLGQATESASVPLATAIGASALTPATATLNAQVVARGADTTAWFEYGTSTAYDNASTPVTAGDAWALTNLSLPITGLASGVEYHFRIVARNSFGTAASSDVVFTPSATANAGVLWVDLRAEDASAGTATWHNRGALGDFVSIGSPVLDDNAAATGLPGVEFNGSSDAYESLAKVGADLSGENDWTIETWALNPTLDQTAETLANMGRRDGNNASWQLTLGSANAWSTGSEFVDWSATTLTSVPVANAWHHLVITFKSKSVVTYVDGVAIKTSPLTADLDLRADAVLLGAVRAADGTELWGADGFSGFINTLRIHGGALTAAQVVANYSAGPSQSAGATPVLPIVTNAAATLVTSASATLHGQVTPGGGFTNVWFEYGETASFGSSTSTKLLASTFGLQNVSEPVGGLTSGQTYHYRLVAQNDAGQVEATPTATFVATGSIAGLPTAVTTAAVVGVAGKATLNGVATPGGIASQAWFEYGVGSNLNLSTSKTSITAATATKTLAIGVSGLLPHSLYSARLAAENTNGKVVGSVVTFLTPNVAPVAKAGLAKLLEDTPTVVILSGSDADKEMPTFVITTPPTHGGVAFSGGHWIYTPAANYNGLDSFMFAATDGVATSAPVEFKLTIMPVEDGPIAQSGNATGSEGQVITGNVLAIDPEGQAAVSYQLESVPNHGIIDLLNTGSFSYTPDAGYNGSDSFTFSASNAGGTSAPALFTLTLTSVPSVPVATDGSFWTDSDTSINGIAQGEDADGDVLSFAVVTPPAAADTDTFDFNTATGEWDFLPAFGFTGEVSFTFKVSANGDNSNTATVTITVGGPSADDATFYGLRDNLISDSVTGSDPLSAALTFAVVSDPQHGSLAILADGSFFYNPDPYFSGKDSFTFNANNGTLNSAPATITLIITERPPDWTWIGGANVAKKPGNYGVLGAGTEFTTPGARSDAAAWTGRDETVWIFGGNGLDTGTKTGLLNDLWMNDSTGNWSWVNGSKTINSPAIYGAQGLGSTANIPGARSGAATWVGQDGKLFLFGGNGRNASAKDVGLLNDLWCYDPVSGEWTWLKGSQALNVNGNNGNGGFSPSTATPGARSGAVSWVDARGLLYLFGGNGRPMTSGIKTGALNDLWCYNPTTHIWSWIGGPGGINSVGTYGVQGIPSGSAWPGARGFATAWSATDGLLYLFGGNGLPGSGAKLGNLNDLWAFDPIAGTWTWLKGSNAIGNAGVYTQLGLPLSANQPSARSGAVSWVGANGDAWIFGGQGAGALNDVWRYEALTNLWTWMKGANKANAPGVYGNLYESASNNTPGARRGGAAVMGEGGDIYLFGGANGANVFNDFWLLTTDDTPGASQIEASNITSDSADVSFKLQPNNLVTDYELSYWPLTDDLNVTTLYGASPEFGTTGLSVPFSLSGLDAGTTYIVQGKATNEAGSACTQRISFTTTGAPTAPTLAFDLAASAVNESAGVANVTLLLDAPATAAFTVPYTLGGTATAGAGGDYIAPSGSITFAEGQLKGLISITLLADTTDEPDETITLTLGTPTGSGAPDMGSPIAHTLTISDDDQAPSIITPPGSQIVAIGGSVTFSVVADGSSLSYQWKKNGAKITGATGTSYSFNVSSLTSAGIYSVEVKNALNTIESAANLYAVDTTSKRVVLAVGAPSTTFNAAAAGPVGTIFTYAWKTLGVSGGPVSDASPHKIGAATKSLKLTGLLSTDSGDYACTIGVTGSPLLVLDTGTNSLSVPTAAPELTLVSALPTGVLGSPYNYQVQFVDTTPSTKAPQSFIVSGLPKGLTMNASTGLISGIPAVVGSSTITVVGKNPVGNSDALHSISASLEILGLLANNVGTYAGTFESNSATKNFGGRLDLTTTPVGAYTGKVTLIDGSYTIKGALNSTVTMGSITAMEGHVSIARKNLPPLDLTFALDQSTSTVLGGLFDPLVAETANMQGSRNFWHKGDTVSERFAGGYTFLIDLSVGDIGKTDIPQGSGFGAIAITSDGKAAITGKTADGQAITISSVIGSSGEIAGIFAPFKTSLGSLIAPPVGLGGPAVDIVTTSTTVNDLADFGLLWRKAIAPSASKDQAYRAGFSDVMLNMLGGKYIAPVGSEVLMGITSGSAVLYFSEAGLNWYETPDVIFDIANTGTSGKQTITVPPNFTSTTFKLSTKPAGQFSGSFIIPNGDPKFSRKATYQGTIVHYFGHSYGAGYFLLPQLPQSGQTLSTSPVLSGYLTLEEL